MRRLFGFYYLGSLPFHAHSRHAAGCLASHARWLPMMAAAAVLAAGLGITIAAQGHGSGSGTADTTHVGDVFGDLIHIKRDPVTGQPILQKREVLLIKTFGSIDNLLAHVDQVPQTKLREKLVAQGEVAKLSPQLATILTDAPVTARLEDFVIPSADTQSLREIFKELEFNRLLNDLPEEKKTHEEDYHLILEQKEFSPLQEELNTVGTFSIDLETNSPYPMWADLVGISFSHVSHQASYIPVGHRPQEGAGQLPLSYVLEQLKPILQRSRVRARVDICCRRSYLSSLS